MMLLLAHKIEIRPTQNQIEFLSQSVGCRRFVYNLCLEEWNSAYKMGLKPDRDYMRFYVKCLQDKYPWLKDVSAHTLDNAVLDLAEAFQRFFKGIARHPRFKKKGITDSFAMRSKPKFKVSGRKIRIEKLKELIPMRERLRFEGIDRKSVV